MHMTIVHPILVRTDIVQALELVTVVIVTLDMWDQIVVSMGKPFFKLAYC